MLRGNGDAFNSLLICFKILQEISTILECITSLDNDKASSFFSVPAHKLFQPFSAHIALSNSMRFLTFGNTICNSVRCFNQRFLWHATLYAFSGWRDLEWSINLAGFILLFAKTFPHRKYCGFSIPSDSFMQLNPYFYIIFIILCFFEHFGLQKISTN